MSFERIQYYYKAGLWSKPMVKMAVRKGVITREQYRDITGEDKAKRDEHDILTLVAAGQDPETAAAALEQAGLLEVFRSA